MIPCRRERERERKREREKKREKRRNAMAFTHWWHDFYIGNPKEFINK